MLHDDYSFQYNQMPHHLLNTNPTTYHTLQPSATSNGQMHSLQHNGGTVNLINGSYNNHYTPSHLSSSSASGMSGHSSYLSGGSGGGVSQSTLHAPAYIPKLVTRTASSNSMSGNSSASSPSSASISSNNNHNINNSSNNNSNGMSSQNNGTVSSSSSSASMLHHGLHHSQLHLHHSSNSMDAADLLDYDSKSGSGLLNDPAELVRLKKMRGLPLTEDEVQLLAKDRQRKDNHNMS
jgi:hypothetical protein